MLGATRHRLYTISGTLEFGGVKEVGRADTGDAVDGSTVSVSVCPPGVGVPASASFSFLLLSVLYLLACRSVSISLVYHFLGVSACLSTFNTYDTCANVFAIYQTHDAINTYTHLSGRLARLMAWAGGRDSVALTDRSSGRGDDKRSSGFSLCTRRKNQRAHDENHAPVGGKERLNTSPNKGHPLPRGENASG